MAAGKVSNDKLEWNDELLASFHACQKHLKNNKTIMLPRCEDILWIVTDGAVKARGIGATLYVVRKEKPVLAGFFNAKLRKHQVTWLPCEVEALSIASAVKHFSPYIVQSENRVCILTDSKPCVQAYDKLCRGEFSASPRVSTFLATVSRYQVSVRHVAGQANVSDFASRNAAECNDSECKICQFIMRTEDSVVRQTSVQDILSGQVKVPFTSRSAWNKTQSECADLRRTHAHLSQGTRPSKKDTDIKDVKRYLNVVSIARDGLLVVKKSDPLAPERDCIVIPRGVVHGIVTALHIKLEHASCHQLKVVMRRYFFALDLNKVIESVTNSCHMCASLKTFPTCQVPQTTCSLPTAVGTHFAADVIKRNKQLILVVRESVTALTSAVLIENETRESLRSGLMQLCIPLRPLEGSAAVIRTDPAPGFKALIHDQSLEAHNLIIEMGYAKNPNKNPVGERAIQELELELLRQNTQSTLVTPLSLSKAVSRLNTRVRSSGLSSREMWTQRDQFTHDQIPVTDLQLIRDQYDRRDKNHTYSERSKSSKECSGGRPKVGDLVYIRSDLDKNRARDRYLVVAVNEGWCDVRKFVGTQLRSDPYRVKISECIRVSQDSVFSQTNIPVYHSADSDEDQDEVNIDLPVIPEVLSRPEIIGVLPSSTRPQRSVRPPVYLNVNDYDCT